MEVSSSIRPSDSELEITMMSARWFAAIGIEEGFGLVPFEALMAGCSVLLSDSELTRELFSGVAGVAWVNPIIPSGYWRDEPSPQIGVDVATKYSWDRTAQLTSDLLSRLSGRWEGTI